MSRFISMLTNNHFSLVAVLPEITTAYAKAAVSAGADAIAVRFDPLKDKGELIGFVKKVDVPVGIILENGTVTERYQIQALHKLGYDFFDTTLAHFTDDLVDTDGMGKVARIGSDFDLDMVAKLSDEPIEGIDAAVIPHNVESNAMTVGDLQTYVNICLSTGLPVIVPTQKNIKPREIPILYDTGAKAILLTEGHGSDIESFSAAIAEYKSEIDPLKE